eukprot:3097731-Prymnesium_polylepis.1
MFRDGDGGSDWPEGLESFHLYPWVRGCAVSYKASVAVRSAFEAAANESTASHACPRCSVPHHLRLTDLKLLVYRGSAVNLEPHHDGALTQMTCLVAGAFANGTGILEISRRADGAWPKHSVSRYVDAIPLTVPFTGVWMNADAWHRVRRVSGVRVVLAAEFACPTSKRRRTL